jgi:FixJ family two-component response regulator
MDNANPTVFVVDDDDAVLQSLRLLLEDVGLNIDTYSSAQAFLDTYDLSRPGCLVLDVRMSGMSGLELYSKLVELNIRLPTIMITGHGDVPMAVQAMKMGVFDFIEKPFRDQVLLDSVQKAIETDAQFRHRKAETADIGAKMELLTQREREIMDLLVSGKSNKTVAYELCISQKTVDFHRSNILQKMGVESIIELVRLAQKAQVT